MRRLLPLALLLAVAAAPALADEFRDAKKQFESAFRPDAAAADRLAAVTAVSLYDTKDAAKLLVDGIGIEDQILDPMVAQKGEVDEKLEKLQGGQFFDEQRTYPEKTLDEIRRLRREAASLQEEIDGEHRVLQEIASALGRVRDADAIEWLGRSALPREKSWRARQTVAAALTEIGTPEAGEYLAKGLRDDDDRVKLTAAVGVGKLRVKSALDDLLRLLRDRDWSVRSAAIQALGDIGEKGAVGPLIDQIEKEEGRLREDCAQALAKLTGQRFGQVPEAWRKWWEEHRDEYGEGGKDLGGHPPDQTGDPGSGYYGIPIVTNRAIFIVDVSGSMSKASSDPSKEPGPNDPAKVEVAKRELIRALKGFDPKGRFNIIAFNDAVKRWKDGLVPATAANKAEAENFVQQFSAAQSTNIYDAMELAFKMAGMGATDKHYEPAADTIFLLSDGSPTKPDGSLDDWMKIIRAVREWNRLKRITIHAIGVGGHNAAFMSMLASENNGRYVSR